MKHEHVEETHEVESGRSGPPFKLIGLLILVAALATFIVQNPDDGPIQFLWLDGTWPMWLVILVSLLAGVVLDRLSQWSLRRQRRRRVRQEL